MSTLDTPRTLESQAREGIRLRPNPPTSQSSRWADGRASRKQKFRTDAREELFSETAAPGTPRRQRDGVDSAHIASVRKRCQGRRGPHSSGPCPLPLITSLLGALGR